MLRLYERHRDLTPGQEHLQPEVDIQDYLISNPGVEAKIKQDLCHLFIDTLFLGKKIVP
jgi:hypothetical protein